MYNLLEYSDNYSMTSGSLWNYYREEINDGENENDNSNNNKNNNSNNNRLNNNKTITSKSFKYKTKIIGKTLDNENKLNAEVLISLKYLSNFWRSFNLPLINCEIELDLSWSRYCVISEISRVFGAVPNTNQVRYQVTSQTTNATFQINIAKIYVSAVTLSITDNIKFLENIRQIFKRTISWNKYRSEIITQ